MRIIVWLSFINNSSRVMESVTWVGRWPAPPIIHSESKIVEHDLKLFRMCKIKEMHFSASRLIFSTHHTSIIGGASRRLGPNFCFSVRMSTWIFWTNQLLCRQWTSIIHFWTMQRMQDTLPRCSSVISLTSHSSRRRMAMGQLNRLKAHCSLIHI